MFFLTIISFFVFAISGLQLVSGGYLIAGVPALAISGLVPVFSSFWSKRRHQDHSGSKKKRKWDICDCLDLGDCGCGCD